MAGRIALSMVALSLALAPRAQARITRIVVTTTPAFEGKSFGNVGTFDKVVGTAFDKLLQCLCQARLLQAPTRIHQGAIRHVRFAPLGREPDLSSLFEHHSVEERVNRETLAGDLNRRSQQPRTRQ